MSSTAENPSAGRTGSCPYTLASPGMSPRKSRTAGPFSFKSTPPVLIGQIRACRGFRRFRPPFIRTLVIAHQIFERYVALAREASTSGDRVAAENLYQHAEHYFRVKNAASEGHQHHATHPTAPADLETEMAEGDGSEMTGPVHIPSSDKQPHLF